MKDRILLHELPSIFKSNLKRSMFISDYPFFDSDGNKDFYIDFIDNNISTRKYKIQEDAIELSIRIEVFKDQYLSVVNEIIHSRRNNWIKLLALDWLFIFYKEISNDVFIDLNEYSWKSVQDDLIKIQCVLNLLLQEITDEYYERLIQILVNSKDSAVFYRLLNSTPEIPLFFKSNSDRPAEVLSIIETNIYLSISQKDELVSELKLDNQH